MVNPYTGEAIIHLDGEPCKAKLTLGALAELENTLESDSLISLIQRFESGTFSSRDVLGLLVAGLRGGGWQGQAKDLLTVEIGGGPLEAARVAAELLARAFTGPPPA